MECNLKQGCTLPPPPHRRESVLSSGPSNERYHDVESFRVGFRPFLAAARPRRARPYNKPPAQARIMVNIARTGPTVSGLGEWAGSGLASARNAIVVVARLPASASAFTMTEWDPAAHGPSTCDWAPMLPAWPPPTLTASPTLPDSASDPVHFRG